MLTLCSALIYRVATPYYCTSEIDGNVYKMIYSNISVSVGMFIKAHWISLIIYTYIVLYVRYSLTHS
jgi:hypothetical protein